MHHEGTGHAGLNHQPTLTEVEDGVLGASAQGAHRRAFQTSHKTAVGGAAEHVVVGQGDLPQGAAHDSGSQLADDRFDFREFGHAARNLVNRPHAVLHPRARRGLTGEISTRGDQSVVGRLLAAEGLREGA